MVGDQKQLAPTVICEAPRLAKSMFSRLCEDKYPYTVLHTQYRMHPDISQLPSKLFYSGLLENGVEPAQRMLAMHDKDRRCGPLAVFNVEQGRQSHDRVYSWRNTEEATFVVWKLNEIMSSNAGKDIREIMILTPYKGQVAAIRDHMQRHLNHAATSHTTWEVGTVDSSQGREADLVIISCVRAPLATFGSCNAAAPVPGVGFLRDKRRMNVALTRARKSLWVVAHEATLRQDDYWRELFTHAASQNVLFPVETAHSTLTDVWSGRNASKKRGAPCRLGPSSGWAPLGSFKPHPLPCDAPVQQQQQYSMHEQHAQKHVPYGTHSYPPSDMIPPSQGHPSSIPPHHHCSPPNGYKMASDNQIGNQVACFQQQQPLQVQAQQPSQVMQFQSPYQGYQGCMDDLAQQQQPRGMWFESHRAQHRHCTAAVPQLTHQLLLRAHGIVGGINPPSTEASVQLMRDCSQVLAAAAAAVQQHVPEHAITPCLRPRDLSDLDHNQPVEDNPQICIHWDVEPQVQGYVNTSTHQKHDCAHVRVRSRTAAEAAAASGSLVAAEISVEDPIEASKGSEDDPVLVVPTATEADYTTEELQPQTNATTIAAVAVTAGNTVQCSTVDTDRSLEDGSKINATAIAAVADELVSPGTSSAEDFASNDTHMRLTKCADAGIGGDLAAVAAANESSPTKVATKSAVEKAVAATATDAAANAATDSAKKAAAGAAADTAIGKDVAVAGVPTNAATDSATAAAVEAANTVGEEPCDANAATDSAADQEHLQSAETVDVPAKSPRHTAVGEARPLSGTCDASEDDGGPRREQQHFPALQSLQSADIDMSSVLLHDIMQDMADVLRAAGDPSTHAVCSMQHIEPYSSQPHEAQNPNFCCRPGPPNKATDANDIVGAAVHNPSVVEQACCVGQKRTWEGLPPNWGVPVPAAAPQAGPQAAHPAAPSVVHVVIPPPPPPLIMIPLQQQQVAQHIQHGEAQQKRIRMLGCGNTAAAAGASNCEDDQDAEDHDDTQDHVHNDNNGGVGCCTDGCAPEHMNHVLEPETETGAEPFTFGCDAESTQELRHTQFQFQGDREGDYEELRRESCALKDCKLNTCTSSAGDAATVEWCTDGCAPDSFSSRFEAEALEQHAELPRGMYVRPQLHSLPLRANEAIEDENGRLHGMQAMHARRCEHNAYNSDFVNPPVGMHGQHAREYPCIQGQSPLAAEHSALVELRMHEAHNYAAPVQWLTQTHTDTWETMHAHCAEEGSGRLPLGVPPANLHTEKDDNEGVIGMDCMQEDYDDLPEASTEEGVEASGPARSMSRTHAAVQRVKQRAKQRTSCCIM